MVKKEAVVVSLCLLGTPCRYHGRPKKYRKNLIKKLRAKYEIIPLCPEQLGGLSTPRPPAKIIRGKVFSGGKNVTSYFEAGAKNTLEVAKIFNVKRAYLKKGSPSCDKSAITGKLLQKHRITVIAVP